jgi:DNA-binding CsgD family transcriptional regulator
LLNSHFQPVHYNAEAASILGYPKKTRSAPSLDPVFTPSQLTSLNKPVVPIVLGFTSGRRRYVCRAFQLDGRNGTDSRVQPRLVLMLERETRQPGDIAQLSEEFQLTNRESETVKLLLQGLTSKEIAVEMCISPNTVKAFLKLAMAKVGASNRTALVARLFNRASLVVLHMHLFDIGLF